MSYGPAIAWPSEDSAGQFYEFHPDAVQVREIVMVHFVRAILG
jgi:hypothetical protein